jgi:hypothetical protein
MDLFLKDGSPDVDNILILMLLLIYINLRRAAKPVKNRISKSRWLDYRSACQRISGRDGQRKDAKKSAAKDKLFTALSW